MTCEVFLTDAGTTRQEQNQMKEPRLMIAVATTAERIARLSTLVLTPVVGAEWVVFVQGRSNDEQDVKRRLSRPDITVVWSEGMGAARNRNCALVHVRWEFLLFADDDLSFSPEGIAALIDRFDEERDMDFLCARLTDEMGALRKKYSPDKTAARWFNTGKVQTPEIALRSDAFNRAGVRFDQDFGAGTPYFLGDEYIFLCDAMRAGLRGQHVDIIVACHPSASSGADFSATAMAVRRRVLIRALGRLRSLPARLAFALRHRRTIGPGGLWALLWG